MKRRTWLAVAAALAVIPSYTAVGATPPTITSLAGTSAIDDIDAALGAPVCRFPVALLFVAGPGTRLISFNGQGIGFGGLITGPLTATVTNKTTGAHVTRKVSGPGFLATDGSGIPVRGTGSWLVIEPSLAGGLRLIRGSMTFELASYGLHAVLNGGVEENLCEAID